MSECPICESDRYTWESGCWDCGYYDEDGHRQRRREKRRGERQIRKDRRRSR